MRARRRSREEWARLVAEAERTTVAETARRRQVCPKALRWWRWKLVNEAPDEAAPTMVPVVVRPAGHPIATVSAAEISVAVASDLLVRFSVGADVRYVAALVATLRSTC